MTSIISELTPNIKKFHFTRYVKEATIAITISVVDQITSKLTGSETFGKICAGFALLGLVSWTNGRSCRVQKSDPKIEKVVENALSLGGVHLRNGPLTMYHGVRGGLPTLSEIIKSKHLHPLFVNAPYKRVAKTADELKNFMNLDSDLVMYQHLLANKSVNFADRATTIHIYDYVDAHEKTDPKFCVKMKKTVNYQLGRNSSTNRDKFFLNEFTPRELANWFSTEPTDTYGGICSIRFDLTTENIRELEKENISGVSIYERYVRQLQCRFIPQAVPLKYATAIIIRTQHWDDTKVAEIKQKLSEAGLNHIKILK